LSQQIRAHILPEISPPRSEEFGAGQLICLNVETGLPNDERLLIAS
jgi:hypothetical protein